MTTQPPGARLGTHLPDPGWGSRRLASDLEVTTRGGKRIRSAVFRSAYRASGGRDDDLESRMSSVLERLHEAFLLHDDVADRDLVRRGEPNVAGRTVRHATGVGIPEPDAHHLGSVAGLLAGDAVLVVALLDLARLDCGEDRRRRLLDEVERAVLVTIHGEYEDVYRSVAPGVPEVDTSVAIARAKTAEYSVALPFVCAAVLAGCADDVVEALRTAGSHLGLAFQLADDLLGVFGDPGSTGKSVHTDLDRRSPTHLLADAASLPQWPEVERALREDLDLARELLDRHGSRERTHRRALHEAAEAARILGSDPVPAAVAEALAPFVDTAVRRSR